MILEQAKQKLAEVSKSTGIKHPKVLISELCGVIQFLLDEVERIKTPPMAVLKIPDDAPLRRLEITKGPEQTPMTPSSPTDDCRPRIGPDIISNRKGPYECQPPFTRKD